MVLLGTAYTEPCSHVLTLCIVSYGDVHSDEAIVVVPCDYLAVLTNSADGVCIKHIFNVCVKLVRPHVTFEYIVFLNELSG